MRYLVTGCYGFIGAHLCQALAALGHEVIGADRIKGANSPKGGRIKALSQLPQFRFLQADTSDESSVRKLFLRAKPNVVVHLAGQYAVAPLTLDLLRRYIATVEGNAFMAWYANAAGVSNYVYASSTFVEPGRPSAHAYGWSKTAVEAFAHVASSINKPWHGMHCTGLRYGSTFGPMCRRDVGIYQLARKLLRGDKIEVKPGSGFHYQTGFLDVRDAIGATLAACTPRYVGPQVLTVVADDHRKDLGEMLRYLEEALGIRARCDWEGYEAKPLGGIATAKLDELERMTGFRPRIKLREAVNHFATWARAAHEAGTL
jgi:UDP-glucuronate 4-epimerase